MLIGSGIFAKKVIEKLGERTGDWIADQAVKIVTSGQPEVRGADGAKVAVDVTNPAASADAIANLMEQAAEKNVRLQIIIEPLG